jgi:hypothetical protein
MIEPHVFQIVAAWHNRERDIVRIRHHERLGVGSFPTSKAVEIAVW